MPVAVGEGGQGVINPCIRSPPLSTSPAAAPPSDPDGVPLPTGIAVAIHAASVCQSVNNPPPFMMRVQAAL